MKGCSMDRINGVMSFLPFVLSTGKDIQMSPKRIMEGVIIAALAGGFSSYATLKITEARVEVISDRIIQIERQVQDTNSKIIGIYKFLADQNGHKK